MPETAIWARDEAYRLRSSKDASTPSVAFSTAASHIVLGLKSYLQILATGAAASLILQIDTSWFLENATCDDGAKKKCHAR
ncbi:MAG: hypothetical protein E5W38_06575 [Mesorhizobium sp.]|uniref:hypothetical protein n=1 Tax=Mesorhizobium sp. TaxID=1871066 RepID=UPI00122158CB|nr:hypothetical protein [Mesorhizobium sp.]TIT95170.1 MAG: hypothetical protein E5W59_02765 [Mesorhizobium sp.]TIU34211.1 MAG: hypothetical protein E5W38_06575 [Mesorhizobium sp.]TIU72097.1 MAG: hypothetical protein E5W25_01935 [Mesorhizobium sp.]TIV32878.1 MAG: hypothetical protein E5V90_01040 [Mesorhizobium sp.]TIV41115.1 MAG: hypothetical protein E5V99_02015 [Mesorhizobium sp.]